MRQKGIIILGVIAIGVITALLMRQQGSEPAESPAVSSLASPAAETFAPPISGALARVTKKPFGLYVSPTDSPVSPERFTGYHTGSDFETLPSEQDADVPIYAICAGPLREKRTASGYGGVAVQQCMFDGASITVVYGHLKLTSIAAVAGEHLAAGERLGILGKGYSTETDGERKHLHLGIHKGSVIDIRGYVQAPADLSAWVNIADYLR
jgi:hypothetical protein